MGNKSIIRPWTTMGIIGGAMISLFSLPIMGLGLQFLWLALRVHIGHPFYVEYEYFLPGLVWLVWGLLILALGLIPFFRRKLSVLALGLGFTLLILAAMVIPSNRMPGDVVHLAEAEARSTLRRTSITLTEGAGKSGRLPASQSELDVLAKESSSKESKSNSGYARDSQRLPYRLIYITGAPGPHVPVPAGDEPGIIYCAVSRDVKRFWLTATGLDEAVAGDVIIVPSFERTGPFVVEESIDPSPDPVKK